MTNKPNEPGHDGLGDMSEYAAQVRLASTLVDLCKEDIDKGRLTKPRVVEEMLTATFFEATSAADHNPVEVALALSMFTARIALLVSGTLCVCGEEVCQKGRAKAFSAAASIVAQESVDSSVRKMKGPLH